jgi:hypothetical protein
VSPGRRESASNDAGVSVGVDAPTRVVPGITIGNLDVPTVWFTGAAISFDPAPVVPGRVLDRAAIRRQLPAPPARVRWHLRVSTFDLHSPKELPATRLDARGLRAAEHALLARSPGGSSHLGPSLRSVESSPFAGRRILIVLSDLELCDPNPAHVLAELIDSSADAVLTIVFRAPTPAELIGTRVHIAPIDPHASVPADIAANIVNMACVTLRQRPQPVRTEDVLIDLLDDESGSMWSGNDAFFLRHEAALIAVEHLATHSTPLRRKTKRS